MISSSTKNNKDEKTTYDNLANSIVCPLNNQYDNFPIVSNTPQISLGYYYFSFDKIEAKQKHLYIYFSFQNNLFRINVLKVLI